MQYRSIGDLSLSVATGAWKVPADVDLIVGIPRSGLLAGSMLALHLNIPIVELDCYLNGGAGRIGRTSKHTVSAKSNDVRKVLVVDLRYAVEGLSDDHLRYIRVLKDGAAVLLKRVAVTDRGLAHLARVKSLEQLDLSETAVTDAGLPHLESLRRLEQLDLTGTRVTLTAVLSFASSSRGLTIEFSGGRSRNRSLTLSGPGAAAGLALLGRSADVTSL